MDAQIIIGANYGDEGKGTVTALYTNKYLGDTLNVLTNGGSQRGHSILTKDGSITYQHFGSGTYHGADSFYCEHFILNPAQFTKEWDALIEKPNVFRDPNCLWTTIWDMMANRIEEERKKRFASCGMGIWNTIRRSRKVYMRFDDFMALSKKEQSAFLRKVRSFYENRLDFSSFWKKIWYDYDIETHFLEDCQFMKDHTTSGTIRELLALKSLCTNTYDNIVFENGQGLLLKDTGRDTFDTTPSDTGATYALDIIQDLENCGMEFNTTLHYVTRPYLTRHGDGNISNENKRTNISGSIQEDRTNQWNSNQGEFRYGKLDISSLKERVENDARGYKYILEVTHCDEMDRKTEFDKMFGPENIQYIDNPTV